MLYKKTVDADGNEVYEEVTPESLDEEVIKATPLFGKVLDETVQRRKRINELQAQLESLASDGDEADEAPPKKQAKPPQPSAQADTPKKEIDPDELYSQFRERLLKEMQEEEKKKKEVQSALSSIIEENRVPSELSYLVEAQFNAGGAEAAKKAAADIAKTRSLFNGGAGGDPETEAEMIAKRAFKKLGFDD